MFHPLIRLLATKPQLLAHHAGAYAELAALQAGAALRSVRQHVLLGVVAGLSAVLGVGLAGVALLLLAVVPVQQMPAPWLLAAGPAVPLALAAGLWVLRTRMPLALALSMAPVQAQWAADLELLAQAGAE